MSGKLHVPLGAVFWMIRRDLGLSQLEVATRAGKKRSDYARFERGEHSPHLSHIEAYAKALGVRASDALKLAELLHQKKVEDEMAEGDEARAR